MWRCLICYFGSNQEREKPCSDLNRGSMNKLVGHGCAFVYAGQLERQWEHRLVGEK